MLGMTVRSELTVLVRRGEREEETERGWSMPNRPSSLAQHNVSFGVGVSFEASACGPRAPLLPAHSSDSHSAPPSTSWHPSYAPWQYGHRFFLPRLAARQGVLNHSHPPCPGILFSSSSHGHLRVAPWVAYRD